MLSRRRPLACARFGALLLAGLLLGVAGSGGAGAPARAVRSDAPTAAQAMNEPGGDATCRGVASGARPLVVDWKSDQRADLEVAMKSAVAVVRYDCDKLELLSDCAAEGSYEFKGVVLKQEVIRLADADEIRVNLPLGGVALVGALKGELARGTTLDLATALIGRQSSTRLAVARPELSGRCEGATHFVRAATVGAFVLQTGQKARLASAAEMFGAGAAAASESSRFARSIDGSLDACKSANSDAAAPPQGCGALLRLQLLPIDAALVEATQLAPSAPSPAPAAVTSAAVAAEATAAPRAAERSAAADTAPRTEAQIELLAECPEGLVFSEGKCAVSARVSSHVCAADDVDDCRVQCDVGDARSCSRLARAYLSGKGVAADDPTAVSLFEKSCKLGHAGGCSNLGTLYATGRGVNADLTRAAQLFDQACQAGEAVGCFNLGSLTLEGRGTTKDVARSAELYRQACAAGKAPACVNLAVAYSDGAGVPVDREKAYAMFQRACEGDEPVGCTNLGVLAMEGRGGPRDTARAARAYDHACRLGDARGCEYLGQRYLKGDGVGKDEARGQELLRRACAAGRKTACPTAP